MTNQTNANAACPVLTTATAGAVFYSELQEWADRLYVGVYADAYADAVLNEARGFMHNAEAYLMPFLCEEACTRGSFFDEFISSQLPVYTAQLVEEWTAAGYPEPGVTNGDIFEQMREGLAEYITSEVSDAIDELNELISDFAERYSAAEEREHADAA